MDPPPSPAAPPPSSTATVAAAYPESGNSSPRSRPSDPAEEPSAAAKLRLMCSYGGHIVPRPHDKSLCYVGGVTRIVVSDRHVTLSDLSYRLSKTFLAGKPFSLKYQLPSEDLDSLISVSTNEDLENMIEEYDRLSAAAAAGGRKSSRLRLFLFPESNMPSFSSLPLIENSGKSDDWFLDALNGATRGEFPESASVNCLLGLDDVVPSTTANSKEAPANSNSSGNNKQQDAHSVPDSPILEKTSSFGSTSSTPSMSNLPPIRVRVEDQRPLPQTALGIEGQFSQMGIATVQKQDDGCVSVVPAVATALPLHSLAKPAAESDLASRDSASSDSSLIDLSRQRPMIYQDPPNQLQSQNQNTSSGVPVTLVDQKLSDSNLSYIYPTQFEQSIQHLNPHHQQQQLNFIQSTSQYVPPGAVPSPAYYILYPPQQQYPSAYVSARPALAYDMQSSYAPSMGPQMVNPSIHHPTQPSSIAATGNYAYKLTDTANHRMVYTQPMAPQTALHYQNESPPPSEASAGLHSHDRCI